MSTSTRRGTSGANGLSRDQATAAKQDLMGTRLLLNLRLTNGESIPKVFDLLDPLGEACPEKDIHSEDLWPQSKHRQTSSKGS